MPLSKETIVSAQVVLRPASGRPIDGRAAISAATVGEYAPPPGAVASAAAEFRARGFEVGPFVGVSFAVTGSVGAFESFFGVGVRQGRDGACEFVVGDRSLGHELAGGKLPGALRDSVEAVVFPLPPDFGPTEFAY